MKDRYVIVYWDGNIGRPWPKEWADEILEGVRQDGYRPAYRIRIREKPRTAGQRLLGAAKEMRARLDPAKAYADAGIRR